MDDIRKSAPELTADEQSIRDEFEKSERVVDALKNDLSAVDGKLAELAQRRQRYDLVSNVCRSLDELEKLGAVELFWNPQGGQDNRARHLEHARSMIGEFNAEVARVETHRQSIVDKIGDQNDVLESLHYDLRDAMAQAESRWHEWLVERDASPLPLRCQVMPWARGCEEDERFRRSLAASILVSLVAGLIVSIIDLPIIERTAEIELPERVARLVREERRLPPPEPVEQPVIPDEEIPEPELVEDTPPEQPLEIVEQPILAEVAQPETKERVKSKGILAFRDSFANRAKIRPTADLGSEASFTNAGSSAVGRPVRSMVTTSAPGSSGGINLGDISRNVGGGGRGIEGGGVVQAVSSIGGGGGDGSARPLSGGRLAGRTDEEIQIVFDRYKAALYRLYNRELRKDPTLRGQMVLQLTIEPDGSVSLCQLQSSNMGAPVLAQQVVDRVRGFDFGAKEGIVAMTIIYPIDFLPAV
jgi:outer membrane biosynthesis protein TonB